MQAGRFYSSVAETYDAGILMPSRGEVRQAKEFHNGESIVLLLRVTSVALV